MKNPSTRASRREIQSLLKEVNSKHFGVRVSYPLPRQRTVVFIVYKDNKVYETKKFDYLKFAREFLISIINGEYP